jgi:predicted nicotinamide N-methyase
MAQLLAGMGCCSSKKKVTTTTAVFSELTGRSNRKSRTMELPDRVSDFLKANQKLMDGSIVALELGCGVGLSGLVAASSLRPALSVLTDLPVVVDKVTKPNVEQNTVEGPRVKKSEPIPYRLLPNSQTKVVAMPLTWGHRGDEEAVLNVLEQLGARKQLPITPRRRKKGASVDQMALLDQRTDIRYPDLILVGDVAYQHKPGAPSHFDALVETLLRMSDGHTVVIFATRIRMEASVDLLLLLRDCFDEVVQPPVQAHEIDAPAFGDVKHNLTIHFLQKKKRQKSLGRS